MHLGHRREAGSAVKRIPPKMKGDRLKSLEEVGEVESASEA